ncbi:MAG: metallophosphoesterase [Clostridiales bacterium]|nr:metallophosphoesterase [Clostridiales bacterium]
MIAGGFLAGIIAPLAVVGAAAVTAVGALLYNDLTVREEIAVFDWLPETLDGLRVLHISDLHGNSETKMNVDIWTDIACAKFDMAVITGDMIKNHMTELKPHMPGIKSLARRVPVFYVEGNHDSLVYKKMAKTLSSAGVIVLDNERQVRRINGVDVPLIGLRDYWTLEKQKFLPAKRLFRSWAGRFHIILSHQPQLFDMTKDKSLGLMLSGHTHGGQVRLPFMPTLYAPGQGLLPKYGNGWYELGKNKLFISCGIGTTDFSLRLFNRPEVAIITLTRA